MSSDLNSEKDLIEKAKKDPEAFSELYSKNYSKIFGYVLKRVANIEAAEDITSETFLKSIKKINQFKWKNIPFSSWLYKIASNEVNDYFRKGKRKTISLGKIAEPESPTNLATEVIEAEKELEKYESFLEINKKIKQLPVAYQEVIVFKFFEKKKVKEIAQILEKKEGTVKSLIHRGLEKLKKELK